MLVELCHCLYFVGRTQSHSLIFVDAFFWCTIVLYYCCTICVPLYYHYCTIIAPFGVPYCLLVCPSHRSTRRTLSDAHNLPGFKPITCDKLSFRFSSFNFMLSVENGSILDLDL